MRIDGRKIAEEIKEQIKESVAELTSRGTVPKIAIITIGDEGAWEVYIRQKIKIAKELGIKAILLNLADSDEDRLLKTIKEVDSDPKYHGIIVQRPLTRGINRDAVINAISKQKDIDGFRADSPFSVPLWLASKRLIEEALRGKNIKSGWKMLKIAVIGKGETAGGPVIDGLKKLGNTPDVIDSKTENPDEILKKADVIVSCVGKAGIVNSTNIKKGAILIGAGIRGESGKAYGDYEEKDISDLAGAYTPTPGGVGPVNLAYLYKNLVEAASAQNN